MNSAQNYLPIFLFKNWKCPFLPERSYVCRKLSIWAVLAFIIDVGDCNFNKAFSTKSASCSNCLPSLFFLLLLPDYSPHSSHHSISQQRNSHSPFLFRHCFSRYWRLVGNQLQRQRNQSGGFNPLRCKR